MIVILQGIPILENEQKSKSGKMVGVVIWSWAPGHPRTALASGGNQSDSAIQAKKCLTKEIKSLVKSSKRSGINYLIWLMDSLPLKAWLSRTVDTCRLKLVN